MNLNYQTAISWSRAHKKLVAVLVVGIMLASYGIVRAISGGAQIQYVFAAVARGTVVSAITGNGSISSSDRVDLSPDGAGNVTYVAPVDGKFVRKGTVLVSLDAADEYQAVQNAQLDLEDARIVLQKLERSQVATVPEREDDVVSAYADAFDVVFDAFQELPGIRDALDESLTGGSLKDGCHSSICEHETDGLLDEARDEFDVADTAYDGAYELYRASDRLSSRDSIATLVDETARVADLLARSLKAEQNILDAFLDDLGSRDEYAQTAAVFDQRLTDSESAVSTLSRNASALRAGRRDTADAERALADAKDTGPLDLASQRNSVQRAQLSLQKARTALADRSVRAPFDGVVSGMDVRAGESLSASSVVATIITDRRIAELTFNEVDISALEVGQKATLMFDAVEDLSLTGTVSRIDSLGTVSQGVVNYDVVIALDTSDERVKPGMSVSASIVTAVSQDTLSVPAAAVKNSGGTQYVEVYPETNGGQAVIGQAIGLDSVPLQRTVTTGISSDTAVEILSGLDEGDAVIVRTITGTSTTSAQQAPSLFQTGGGGRTGGGNIRTFQAR